MYRYYDYYQPEAYIASTDTYIEKDSSINDEIDRLRHSATAALQERRDVIIVASVSCIYSMGDPSEYDGQMISLRPGMTHGPLDELLRRLVEIQYDRNDIDFGRGTFRVRGDMVEIIPAGHAGAWPCGWNSSATKSTAFREFSTRSRARLRTPCEHIADLPGHALRHQRQSSAKRTSHVIEQDLQGAGGQVRGAKDKLLEAERIAQRTRYDIEMLREIGFCTGH